MEQIPFAAALEIDRRLLGAYEHGRIPVPFYVAARVCTKFYANPAFLVNGWPPRKLPTAAAFMHRKDIPARALLSDAYDRFLKSNVEAEHDYIESMLRGCVADIGFDTEKMLALFNDKRNPAENAQRLFDHFVRNYLTPQGKGDQAYFFLQMTEMFARFVQFTERAKPPVKDTTGKK